jgi:hypothetical protein
MKGRKRTRRFRMEQRQRLTLRRLPVVVSVFIVVATAVLTIYFNFSQHNNIFANGSGSAIASGNWNAASSWSFSGVNRIPTCGDTVIIPALKTITVNNQENISGCGSPVVIKVYGILQFTNGNKLDLPCNSYVYIMTGGVIKKATAGGGSSTLISICSTTLWTAGDGPLPGPDTLYVPPSGGGTSLPIELIYFKAGEGDDGVNFNWATANEINNDFFTVERSEDGEHFEPLFTKAGAGNSTSNLYYDGKDEKPLQGFSYYRLKQTDYDGHYSYSDIETVKNGKGMRDDPDKLEIKSVSPNPFTDHFKVSFIIKSAVTVDFMLSSSTGQIVAQEKIQAEEGMNTYEFTDHMNLEKGIYYLTLGHNDQKVTQKIISN